MKNARETGMEFADPFLREDGSWIAEKEEWEAQKERYRRFLLEHLYGTMPEYAGGVAHEVLETVSCYDGRAVRETVLLGIRGKDGRQSMKLPITVLRPRISGRIPVIVWNCSEAHETCPIEEELICSRRFGLVFFDREALAADGPAEGVLEQMYPGYGWGRVAQWSWGISRILDYLDTTEYALAAHYVVTGHSRGGKVSLCAGIFDERILLCHANDSGCGGAGSWQFFGSRFGWEIGSCETFPEAWKFFPYWWGNEMEAFARREDYPLDAHILRALVAPRSILTTEANGDTWSNPYGTLAAWRAAQEVFEYLGCPENNAIQYREGGHDFLEIDWRAMIDYYDMQYRGDTRKHTIVYFEKGWKEGQNQFDWRNIRLHYSWRRP